MGDENELFNELDPAAGEESAPPPDYQLYLDMPDWKDIPPPPSYEDAVIRGMDDPAYPPGYQSQSVAASTTKVSALGYVDFLPRVIGTPVGNGEPQYEEFKVIMTMANNWLSSYPQYRVLSCQSIERKVSKNGLVDAESTVEHTAAWGENPFIRGLRLWLTSKTDNSKPQQIWYMNVMPKPIPQKIIYGHGHRYGGGMFHSGFAMTMKSTTIYPDFEDLDETVVKLNEKLKENPIPGSILNIESIDMKYGRNFWDPKIFNPHKHPYDPDKGYWSEVSSDSILFLNITRIFFIQGPSQQVQIGFEDFAPGCVKNILGGKPVFQKMSEVVPRVQAWMTANKSVQITNVNTIQTKVSKNVFETGTDQVRVNSKNTFYSAGSNCSYVNVIRVAFIKPGKSDANAVSIKSFVPIRKGGTTKSESFAEVMARINTWLAVTGADVLNAGTLHFEFSPQGNVFIDPDKTATHMIAHRGYHWMTVIQLYIRGSFIEPPPEVLPPAPAFAKTQSSTCEIL